MRFEVPITCVAAPDRVWPELQGWDRVTPMDAGVLSKRSGGILNNWVLRTYYHLALAGHPVTLAPRPQPGHLNLVSILDFGRKQRRADCFLVIPQADAHETLLADFRIFQNGLRATDDVSAVIWHWPQPGILPRDPARGDTVSHLTYKGRTLNLDPEFRSPDFLAELQARGFSFDIDAFDGLHADHDWNDYRAADAVLALRNMTHYDAAKKPASKLINAWMAGVPALLGPEPAFEELRQSADDFLTVRSPRDILNALETLRADPARFQAMVANGRTRAQDFTEAALTDLWVQVLAGPATAAYHRWQAQPGWQRRLRTWRNTWGEGAARKANLDRIVTGARLLDDPLDETKKAVS